METTTLEQELTTCSDWWSRSIKILRDHEYLETTKHHMNVSGGWKAARKKQHTLLITKILADLDIPQEGRAFMIGGLPGSGKSTMLSAVTNPKNYYIIDPDVIKELMVKLGMAPVVPGLTPMEAGPLFHFESTQIAKQLTEVLTADKVNVCWPMTFTSSEAVQTRVQMARSNGYKKIDAAYVEVSLDTSTRRVKERHERGVKQYLLGQGLGGRLIDLDRIDRVAGTYLFTKFGGGFFDTAKIVNNDEDL